MMEKRKGLVVSISLFAIIAAVILGGCIENKTSPVESLEDVEFEEWYYDTIAKIEIDTTEMASAIENYDCISCEVCANRGYEDANNALVEIGRYEVSSEMQPVKDNFEECLKDFKEACYYTELGAMKYEATDLETAARYVTTTIAHFEEVDKSEMVTQTPVIALKRFQSDLEQAAQILRETPTPVPTPKPTPATPMPQQ